MTEPASAAIVGLLIEGVDYAGKTAVATAICDQLAVMGRPTRRRACFVNQHPVIDGLLALAKQSARMDERDVCYTAAILLDTHLPPSPRQAGYLVQERHVPTQIGRNTFFYDDPVRWHVDALRTARQRFSCQVYLTSDLESKRSRTRTRPPKSPRDALLAADPVLHQRYDDFQRAQLPADEGWRICDTTGRSVADLAAELVGYLVDTDHGALDDRV